MVPRTADRTPSAPTHNRTLQGAVTRPAKACVYMAHYPHPKTGPRQVCAQLFSTMGQPALVFVNRQPLWYYACNRTSTETEVFASTTSAFIDSVLAFQTKQHFMIKLAPLVDTVATLTARLADWQSALSHHPLACHPTLHHFHALCSLCSCGWCERGHQGPGMTTAADTHIGTAELQSSGGFRNAVKTAVNCSPPRCNCPGISSGVSLSQHKQQQCPKLCSMDVDQ